MARRTVYRVADQSLLVEAEDRWAANAIDALFSGWYVAPAGEDDEESVPAIVVRNMPERDSIPAGWGEFEVARLPKIAS